MKFHNRKSERAIKTGIESKPEEKRKHPKVATSLPPHPTPVPA